MTKVVTFGEIMMRLATPGYQRFAQATEFEVTYAGGEANVAVSLANYGMDAHFVTALPKSDIADAAIRMLHKFNVKTDYITRSGDRLGVYFLETGAVSRGSKVIYDRANSALANIKKGAIDWDKVFDGATWFHWTGITPSVSQSAAEVCREAIDAALKRKITISTDLNYRAKLWKWGKKAGEVMEGLVKDCDVILGNEEDADMVFGIRPEKGDVKSGSVEGAAYESVSRQLMQKFPKAKKVVVTLRGSISASHNSWSGVLWDGKRLYQGPTYQITHIVDRVGGGDAFMGGLIYGLITYPNDDQRALNFAIAASCLKHTIKGDFNLVTVDEVEKLMGGDASGRVAR